MATLTAPLSFKDWQKEQNSKRLIELVSELEELALNLTTKFTKLGNSERPMLHLVDMPGTGFDINLVNNFYNSVKEFYNELNITKEENANIKAFFRFENEFGRIPVILRELEFIVQEEYKSFLYTIKKSWNDLLKDRRPFEKTWFDRTDKNT